MNFASSSKCSFYFLRLSPGADLRKSLTQFCQENKITAGSVVSGVGSLNRIHLRKANSESFYESSKPHEILTVSGLVSHDGVHLHLSVADKNACVFGGHLSDGNIIFTTAELVIARFEGVTFAREFDPQTGFKELAIRSY